MKGARVGPPFHQSSPCGRSLTFEIKAAEGLRDVKSAHMRRDKAKGKTRFVSGRHRSFTFRAPNAIVLEDWTSFLREHVVATVVPKVWMHS